MLWSAFLAKKVRFFTIRYISQILRILKDMIYQTKALRAFYGGRTRDEAYRSVRIKLPYPNNAYTTLFG
jgi:hypothetical protein